MAGLNPQLQLLLAAQQGAHVGQGGRPQPMPDQERAALLDHAKHNKPEKMPESFTAAPEDDDAADLLAAFVIKLLLNPKPYNNPTRYNANRCDFQSGITLQILLVSQ